MLGRLNHVGIAVPSLDDAVTRYLELFGADTPVSDVIELPVQKVRVRFVHAPNAEMELLEPYNPDGDADAGPIAAFLVKNPAGGQHHVAFEVPDIHAAMQHMIERDARVLGEPRTGAHGTQVVFVHPKDFTGVLLELMEPPAPSGH